LYYWS